MKAVHTMSVKREIPIRGNVPAKKTAASGYLRKEDMCFSRTAITWEGSRAIGASSSHGENWGTGGYSCVGCFLTYCHCKVGDYPRIIPVQNSLEGRCASLWSTHWEQGGSANHRVPSICLWRRRADGSGSGLVLFLVTQRWWPGGGKARQGEECMLSR